MEKDMNSARAACRKFVSDNALYLTDNGRIVCGAHCGTSAAYTGRDISGQKIERVTPEAAASSGQQLVECSIVGADSGGELILKAQTCVYEWIRRERLAYTIEIDPEIHVPRSIT
jgi:hypothetical protein